MVLVYVLMHFGPSICFGVNDADDSQGTEGHSEGREQNNTHTKI